MVCYSHTMPEKVTFKTGISLPESLHARALQRANSVSGGKFARYVQQLINADLAAEPVPTSHDAKIIQKLATTYAGYLAPRLAAHLQADDVDQPKLIHDLLAHLQECYACGAHAEDMAVVPRWELRRGHKWYSEHPEDELAAAEDPADYKTSPPKSP